MRRVRSELLTAKPRASSAIAGGSTISPLKLALHRAQAAAYCPDKPSLASQRAAFEIQTSLVSKGMRNIFAPAPPSQSSPQQPRLGSHIEMIPEDAPPCSSSADLTAAEGARESMRKIARPRLVQERQSARSPSTVTDVPHDLLQAVIGNSDNVPKLSTPLSQVSQMMLGLPTEPPVVRISPRRPTRQPPAVALLGDVMLSIQYAESEEVDESRPGIAFDLANDIATRDSILSEVSSTNVDDLRASFDFTAEYARLDRGEQRASFVEALREASSADALKGEKVPKLSSIAPATATPTDAGGAVATFLSLRSSVNHHIAIRGKSVADGGTSTEAVRDGSRYRPDPFKGQLAFQQHVSQARDSKGRAFSQSAPPCELAYQAPVHPRRRGHKRGESGLSIATMSSFGAVIETGIAGDYVNHFEANFAEHLNTASIVTADSVDAISQVCVLVSPTDLLSLDSVENDEREAAQKTRHSRTLSVQSVESVLGLEHDSVTGGWSVSMSNSRRSSYISRNRRSGSTDSAFGRVDWASYKRKSSTRSDTSNISASSTSRLGRPGVGERMFQLDKSVQLSSIAGSPSDEPAPSKDMLTWPFDPLLEQQAAVRTSSFDSDSVFGGHASGRQSGLILKGLRPGSLVSTVSSSEDPDDTFVNLRKYAKHLASPKAESKEPCLQAEGEDKSMMSKPASRVINSRELITASYQVMYR